MVKRTAMGKRLRFFFAMFSTSGSELGQAPPFPPHSVYNFNNALCGLVLIQRRQICKHLLLNGGFATNKFIKVRLKFHVSTQLEKRSLLDKDVGFRTASLICTS